MVRCDEIIGNELNDKFKVIKIQNVKEQTNKICKKEKCQHFDHGVFLNRIPNFNHSLNTI